MHIPLVLFIGKRQRKRQLWEGLTVHCQPNLSDQVVFCRCGLRTSNGAGSIGVADPELVIIPSVRTEILRFDLVLLNNLKVLGPGEINLPSGCNPHQSLYTPCQNPPLYQRLHLMPHCSWRRLERWREENSRSGCIWAQGYTREHNPRQSNCCWHCHGWARISSIWWPNWETGRPKPHRGWSSRHQERMVKNHCSACWPMGTTVIGKSFYSHDALRSSYLMDWHA